MEIYLNEYLNYVYNLNSQEIFLLAILTFLLLLFICGKWFGKAGVLAILIIGLISYSIYRTDLMDKYFNEKEERRIHEEYLQKEINR